MPVEVGAGAARVAGVDPEFRQVLRVLNSHGDHGRLRTRIEHGPHKVLVGSGGAQRAGEADAGGDIDDHRVHRAPQQRKCGLRKSHDAKDIRVEYLLHRGGVQVVDTERLAEDTSVVHEYVGPGVQRIVDRLGDLPVGVFSAAHDILLWNPLWAALLGDPSAQPGLRRNLAWRVFSEEGTTVTHTAGSEDEFRADLVADLRSAVGRYPDDAPLQDLVNRLLAESDEFATRWAQAHVALYRSSRKTVHTKTIGDITVDCDVLSEPGSGDLRIVVYTVEPESPDA
ncbi:hypothetical protein [Rhodococcus sp. IEGM 1379]|uniref:MmyB family transcriptional regulator n=1 Tax=Rhodococcus sp. IEGM 1379 TaxID=3047086 RepID=UPI0024B7C0CF|nr:hypothetical protein [Rhodococcus sp. IEGM 1379]MDI9915895.1 hypothetical protein [Rhodococcus sp. IEGM 1379]